MSTIQSIDIIKGQEPPQAQLDEQADTIKRLEKLEKPGNVPGSASESLPITDDKIKQ